MSGIVFLVGAGPGAPGLLTARALELISSADVVAHDLLVSQEILSLVPPEVELIPVGRRAGHPRPEYRLHPDVLDRAQAGKRVVRLKAGDPLVFGRGAEEAEVLAEAGIPFEIVPGISAAMGAAAGAGIPLTDRRICSGAIIATGHQLAEDSGEPTIVLYMVSNKLGQNIERLFAAGRGPQTPAAYVASASLPGQQVIVGLLGDLEQAVAAADPVGPALLIVGEVVRLREKIGWFAQRPLAGRRVLVARARPGPSRIASGLRDAGADVIETPRVTVHPPQSQIPLDRALHQWGSFDAVLFGCETSVDATLQRVTALELDMRDLPRRHILAIGSGAASRLAAAGLRPSASYPGACAEALASDEAQLRDKRLLLITSEDGRPSLVGLLHELGARTTVVAAYRHGRQFASDSPRAIDLLVLPSSSAAMALLEAHPELRETPIVAIGPQTARAASSLGAPHITTAKSDTIEAVIECCLKELVVP